MNLANNHRYRRLQSHARLETPAHTHRNRDPHPSPAGHPSPPHQRRMERRHHRLHKTTFPLTSLVCRALDHLDPANPKNIREQVIEELHRYIDTDTILFFAPRDQAGGKLVKMQLEEWQPLIRWGTNAFWGVYARSAEKGIANFERQPWKTRNVLKNWMMT